MFGSVVISPSILSADFMNLEHDIKMIEKGGARWVHVDVMDGHFVPNLTIGVAHVAQLKKITKLPLDVHLMITNPLDQLDWYLEAGADIITMHYETLHGDDEVRQAINRVHERGRKVGIALKPDCPVEVIYPYLPDLDMVLIMSVYPGFSGQTFIKGTEERIASVVAKAQELGCNPLIQVDGGVGTATVAGIAAAGAEIFVCGNAVMKAQDPAQAIADITKIAQDAQQAVS